MLNSVQKTPHYFINPCNTNKNQTECLKYKENKGNTSFKSISDIPASKLGTIRTLSFGNKGTAKQDIKPEYFFIRMAGYGQNYEWANGMVKIAQEASQMISEKKDFITVLSHIEDETREIDLNINKDWLYARFRDGCEGEFRMRKTNQRGAEYYEIYKDKAQKGDIKANSNEYKDADTCTITHGKEKDLILIKYPNTQDNRNIFEFCKQAYSKLTSNPNPSEEEVLETCAKIKWLITQGNPYFSGNDAIGNLLVIAIMHSYNIEISPIKEGISLDFEAFCTDLDDYITQYPTFFEKYPVKLT